MTSVCFVMVTYSSMLMVFQILIDVIDAALKSIQRRKIVQ